jgi:hypothetical protein
MLGDEERIYQWLSTLWPTHEEWSYKIKVVLGSFGIPYLIK